MRGRVEIYQFGVVLLEAAPPIWRTIQVPGTYSFWDLHVAIQDSMGWLDYHLRPRCCRGWSSSRVHGWKPH